MKSCWRWNSQAAYTWQLWEGRVEKSQSGGLSSRRNWQNRARRQQARNFLLVCHQAIFYLVAGLFIILYFSSFQLRSSDLDNRTFNLLRDALSRTFSSVHLILSRSKPLCSVFLKARCDIIRGTSTICSLQLLCLREAVCLSSGSKACSRRGRNMPWSSWELAIAICLLREQHTILLNTRQWQGGLKRLSANWAPSHMQPYQASQAHLCKISQSYEAPAMRGKLFSLIRSN